ncbi:MAG: hypothetical protein HOW73_26335 [Polyangiaceae bacterium]|nr:hypothetical protein [Polyangiaceae bacterium]
MRLLSLLPVLALCACDPNHASTQTLHGENLRLDFTLRADDDPTVGFNHFGLVVRDKKGGVPIDPPVVSASSASAPGTEVPVNVQPLGDGRFALLDVMFATSGMWTLSVRSSTTDGSNDSARFDIAVQ